MKKTYLIIKVEGTPNAIDIFKPGFAKKFIAQNEQSHKELIQSIGEIYKKIKENETDTPKLQQILRKLEELCHVRYDLEGENEQKLVLKSRKYDIVIVGDRITVYKSPEYIRIGDKMAPIIPKRYIKHGFRFEGLPEEDSQ